MYTTPPLPASSPLPPLPPPLPSSAAALRTAIALAEARLATERQETAQLRERVGQIVALLQVPPRGESREPASGAPAAPSSTGSELARLGDAFFREQSSLLAMELAQQAQLRLVLAGIQSCTTGGVQRDAGVGLAPSLGGGASAASGSGTASSDSGSGHCGGAYGYGGGAFSLAERG